MTKVFSIFGGCAIMALLYQWGVSLDTSSYNLSLILWCVATVIFIKVAALMIMFPFVFWFWGWSDRRKRKPRLRLV